MGKRDEFWERLPRDHDDEVVWPDDSEARAALAKDVLGARVIGAVEAMVLERWEIADGVPPKPGSPDYQQEAAVRALFASLSEEQRVAVRALVKRACFSTLYWVLVKLRECPGMEVDVTLSPWMPDGAPLPDVGLNETELYFWYFDWVEKFSELGDK